MDVICSSEISIPVAPRTDFVVSSRTGDAALKIIFPVEESIYGSVSTVSFFSMHPYQPRPVISQPSSLVKPSDCVSALASRSEIHAAITLLVSVFAIWTRLSITVSIFSAWRMSLPAVVSVITDLISGLTDNCSTLFVYCSRNPVSWFAAALDSCISEFFLDVMLSHPTMQIATAAIIRSTRITLPPIW